MGDWLEENEISPLCLTFRVREGTCSCCVGYNVAVVTGVLCRCCVGHGHSCCHGGSGGWQWLAVLWSWVLRVVVLVNVSRGLFGMKIRRLAFRARAGCTGGYPMYNY